MKKYDENRAFALLDKIGFTRVAGSSEELKAAKILKAECESFGLSAVIEPFEIPDGWTICRSYDFGYGKPFSCAWWAVDYDGVIYRILELYGCTRMPNEGV